ncbi:hypothetical protein SAMN04488061_3654, partial [Filomicrobium insigne]
MSPKQNVRRLVWPAILTLASLGLVLAPSPLVALFGDSETLRLALTALAYFATAWLISRITALALDRAATKRRPYPRLLKDLVAAMLFLVAFAAVVSLFMGKGALG